MKGKKAKNPAQILSKKGAKPSKEVLKRFFTDKCSVEAVQIVHIWFTIAQGQVFVFKEIDKEFKLLDEGFDSAYTCDNKVDSTNILNRILKIILQKSSTD